jgi:hypothetical protein
MPVPDQAGNVKDVDNGLGGENGPVRRRAGRFVRTVNYKLYFFNGWLALVVSALPQPSFLFLLDGNQRGAVHQIL